MGTFDIEMKTISVMATMMRERIGKSSKYSDAPSIVTMMENIRDLRKDNAMSTGDVQDTAIILARECLEVIKQAFNEVINEPSDMGLVKAYIDEKIAELKCTFGSWEPIEQIAPEVFNDDRPDMATILAQRINFKKLSTRLTNILKRADIITVGEIFSKKKELSLGFGFGQGSRDELTNYLLPFGLSLSSKIADSLNGAHA